ncbi:diguanylate cyclase [Pseudonocardiaceae bacterium YIM PH 21723]|nr:diguanylate cyclase [Pseudonocardiaceae bacterium YIM PH 21723]
MRNWPLLRLRAPALIYWLAVEAAAVVAVIFVVQQAKPPSGPDLEKFATIATTSAVVIVGTALAIQVRRETQRNPWAIHVSYIIAGTFTLPVGLLVLLMLGPALQGVLGPRPDTHRWVFNTACTTLAGLACRAAAGWDVPQWDAASLIISGAVLLVVRAILVAIGLRLRSPLGGADEVLGDPIDVVLGIVAVSIGAMMAISAKDVALYALLAGPPMALLERAGQIPQWRRSAQRDAKTGLANALHWDRMARDELVRARTRKLPTALLLLDLDHFKRVNDEVGHLAGDAVLAAVAVMLRASVRRADLVGRFGGEEFVVLLPDASPEVATSVAQRVRISVASLRVPATASDGRACELSGLTVSIGVATSERYGYDLATLLVASDSALLAAKGAGRNLVTMA